MTNANCEDVRNWRVIYALSQRAINRKTPISTLSRDIASIVEYHLHDTRTDGLSRYRFSDGLRLPVLSSKDSQNILASSFGKFSEI